MKMTRLLPLLAVLALPVVADDDRDDDYGHFQDTELGAR